MIFYVVLAALTGGCGKKGPPLPPLVRVPAPVSVLTARRVGDEVFLTFQVPSKNIDGSAPADIARVEVFALTTDAMPPYVAFLERGARIATFTVSPAASSTEPARAPSADAVAPGSDVTVRDALIGDALVPVSIPSAKGRGVPPPTQTNPSATSSAAGQTPPSPRRYYVAVASSARQRSSPTGTQASVTVGASVAPPAGLAIVYDERTLTLSWNSGAKGEAYNVYRDLPVASNGETPAPVVVPMPLNGSPLDVAVFTTPVQFGQEMCFRVGAVRVEESGERLEGNASNRACKTPVDSFPPAPPADVRAASGTGEITIQWLPNAEPDLAGYLVLRGAPGDATLAPITSELQKTNRYVDRSVMPGVRYVYAVVAIDNAPDPNRSLPSARDEATAR